jgi:hypothetical protein
VDTGQKAATKEASFSTKRFHRDEMASIVPDAEEAGVMLVSVYWKVRNWNDDTSGGIEGTPSLENVSMPAGPLKKNNCVGFAVESKGTSRP